MTGMNFILSPSNFYLYCQFFITLYSGKKEDYYQLIDSEKRVIFIDPYSTRNLRPKHFTHFWIHFQLYIYTDEPTQWTQMSQNGLNSTLHCFTVHHSPPFPPQSYAKYIMNDIVYFVLFVYFPLFICRFSLLSKPLSVCLLIVPFVYFPFPKLLSSTFICNSLKGKRPGESLSSGLIN